MKTSHRSMAALLAALCCTPSLASAEDYSWSQAVFEGGGFISGILASKSQPGLVYARTDVGGIYRWDSTGGRWIPLMDWVSEIEVGWLGTLAMGLDPSEPARIYALGGTKYFSDGRTVFLRSKDYGATFDTIDVSASFKVSGNSTGRNSGEKIAVDPRNSAIIYCGSQLNGLWKSSDTGSTWNQVSALGKGSSVDNDIGVSFVLVDPLSPAKGKATSRVIMGLGNTSTNLYRSDDSGATFTAIEGGPKAQMPLRAVLVGDTLYLAYSDAPGPQPTNGGSIWKYSLSAKTWTDITPEPTGQHGYGAVDVDPTDSRHLVASTLGYYGHQWRWSNGKENYGDQVFVSRDGGATWIPTSVHEDNTGSNATLAPAEAKWCFGQAIHWAGSVVFDPFHKGHVWIASGNGIFRTDSVDVPNTVWTFRSLGIEESVPLDAVSVEGGPLVTAIGDFDGGRYDDPLQPTPQHDPAIGSTLSLGYGPLNGTFLRAGHVTDYSTGTGIEHDVMYFSRDTARTWEKLPTPMGGKGLTVLNADGSVFLHRPESGSNSILRSVDRGVSWTTATGLDGQANSSKVVCDPLDPARFYLLDQQGYFLASTDSGSTFTKVGRVSDDSKSIYQNSTGLIRAVPHQSGALWIPLDQGQPWQTGYYSRNGLALTEDGGKTFQRFPAVTSATAIGLGKAAPGSSYPTLFIWGMANGGPVGIYRSTDKAATWTRINDDRHQFGGPGNGKFVQGDMNTFGRVYMSTVGRGLVCGSIASPTSVAGGTSARSATSRLGWSAGRILVRAPGLSGLRLEVRDASGKLLLDRSVADGETVPVSGMRGLVFARLGSTRGWSSTSSLAIP